MKVLSLFDGISCARIALEELGVDVECYFASEIDEMAIQTAQRNWSDQIQLGSVTGVTKELIESYSVFCDIDLLIGGSPCQDLSRAKHGGEGLKGSRSGLFYEYVRVLREVKPKWFILENVASMKADARAEITKELGVEPIMIDAALVSAQSRRRLFWTNIPGITQPKDQGIMLKDILTEGTVEEQGYEKGLKPIPLGVLKGTKGGQGCRIYSAEGKAVTLPSTPGGNKTGLYWILPDGKLAVREATKKGYAIAEEGDSVDICYPNSKTRRGRVGKKAKNLMTQLTISVFERKQVRPLHVMECERLQCVPDGYTGPVSKTAAIKMLGNGFNVRVIKHIISHIPKSHE